MKKTISGIMLTLLILSMLTIAFSAPSVKAVTDPIISGTVRDKLGNPIPNVLIVAQDALTELDVASATSNATGAYAMIVPPSTYNLIVTPPPESGFAATVVSNVKVTADVTMDIVLVPAETITFSGQIVDRDGYPVPSIGVYLYSGDIWIYASTNETGHFSMFVSPGSYNLRISGGFGLSIAEIYKSSPLNLTENTFITITLQNRYLSGKVVDPKGNPISDVSIFMRGSTIFDDFNGYFEKWTTTDSNGNFNVTIYTSSSVSIRATPPPESALGQISITNINVTQDASITVVLPHAIAFGGLVVDRDGYPVPSIGVYLYSATGYASSSTDEQGLFSMYVSPGSYSLRLSGGFGLTIAELYKITTVNLTEDTFITITLQNRYLSGKVVGPEGDPVSNVSIFMRGSTIFDDFNGYFEKWTTTDSNGNFNVTIYTCSNVVLKATPPSETPFAPISITNINATEDTFITVTFPHAIAFGGLVVDRDGYPVPSIGVYLYSGDIWIYASTNETGHFSMFVSPGSYNLRISGGFGLSIAEIYKVTPLNITEDSFITITLQNRYLTGKVDCEGKPVPNVSIFMRGSTIFDDFNGYFEKWTTTDSNGNFNVTIYTSSSVSIRATPPPESIYAPVSIHNIDVTDDRTILIALSYKAGVLPIANFAWTPETPEAGQMVSFDASASIPGSGIIIRHKWSFGDGTYAIGKIVTHSYATPGVYTVTLNVTNSKGLWDVEQKQIQVVEPAPGPKPPVASFTYKPPNPRVNETVTFDASGSYDSDGQIVSYSWSFGDGLTGEGKIATHSYSKEGNYKVTLTVVDNDGRSSSTSKTLTVLRPKTDERIEDAIAWALDWADGPPYPPGGPHAGEMYIGWCLAFVQDAYQFGAGAKIQRYEYAKQAADALGAGENKGIPPRGAFVFYNWYGTIDGVYQNWGHVGLSLGDGQMVHAWTSGPVVASYDEIGLEYIGWAWPPLTPPIKTRGLSILATCPVDLVVIDPDYLVISKEYSEIPEAVYIEEDLNGDGSPDDYIFIPERKTGEYLITVIPEPDADPTATYTLEVSSEGLTFMVAENVPISDIPTEPYILDSTTFEIPAFVAATIDIDPNALNLRSKGKWITAYIELPEGYDVSNINVSTVMLNGTVSAELKPVTIGDYDNDIIPDLMVKFDRTAVCEFILSKGITVGNVTLTVSGRLYDGTEFEGCDVICVRMPGDINMDGKVDMIDISILCRAFGSYPGHSRWNPTADENEDGIIDIFDIALTCRNYGKTYK